MDGFKIIEVEIENRKQLHDLIDLVFDQPGITDASLEGAMLALVDAMMFLYNKEQTVEVKRITDAAKARTLQIATISTLDSPITLEELKQMVEKFPQTDDEILNDPVKRVNLQSALHEQSLKEAMKHPHLFFREAMIHDDGYGNEFS